MRTQKVLREAHVAARALSEDELTATLRAMLTITDLGMLITDLEHRSLACNSKFGEIFSVDSDRVPDMGVEELRGYVYPRLADREGWLSHLDELYADPKQRLEDELVLESPFQVLHRTTGPVMNADDEIIGRIWTFADVTDRTRRQRRRDVIVEASSFHHPDPARVCRYVVQRVAEEYDSIALLSIRDGDRMLFREAAGMPPGMDHIRENQVRESYCRAAIENLRPIVVQDALEIDEFRDILPARLGLRRCLTVPICNMSGAPIGTLCFMDGRTEEALTQDDVEFISVLANRLATELERERLYEERTAAQRTAFDSQGLELGLMEGVLEAMNAAFKLVGAEVREESVWEQQARLLRGVMGYSSAAIIRIDGRAAIGWVSHLTECSAVKINPSAALRDRPVGAWVACSPKEAGLAELFSESNLALVRLPIAGDCVILVLARDEVSPLTERHHTSLLSALADQVALLLSSHRMRADLEIASADLRKVESRLVQAEKLAITGTLAASIAHDIRNIMASTSLICSQPGLSDAEKLAQVKTQIDRFAVLSHRLLSYVRPKSISRQSVDLDDVIAQAIELLSPQARIAGVEIIPALAPIGMHLADPFRIEHLLVNLMLNGMQAMDSSGGVIRVSSGTEEGNARISIEDNGRGIAPHLLEKIFEPFVSSRQDGFGLGLYSCRQIANEHGWELRVASETGKGTLFTLDIPVGG
jgi:signal transduction histidine kinase